VGREPQAVVAGWRLPEHALLDFLCPLEVDEHRRDIPEGLNTAYNRA
jgi:hypothetical protein